LYFAEEMSSKGNFCTETAERKTEKSAPTATAAGKKPEKLKIRCSAEWWFHKKSHHSYFVTETETKYYETQK
jgi:hypothetical protein